MNQSTERWLPVVGHEGLYEVSDCGRVRSLDRVAANGRNHRGRVLSPGVRETGHRYFNLRDAPHPARKGYAHVLVLEAFVGPRPLGMEGCHNDGDPTNNVPGNLRWDTRSENVLDRVRHHTHHASVRTHCPRNHPLVAPNLVTAPSVHGKRRQCLACKRARSMKRQTFTQALADEKYLEIMSRA